jgi:hypothetical protein
MSIKGRVYKLVSNHTNDIYIGSTTQSLGGRKSGHKNDYKKFLDGRRKGSCASFTLIEKGEIDIILLEEVSCETIKELKERERYWIETTDCINIKIPNQTRKEWYEKNKDGYSVCNKEWRLKNPNYMKEWWAKKKP